MPEYSTVRLRNDLVEKIDHIVEERRDTLDLQMFKSRADFVSSACKRFLKELQFAPRT